MNLETKDPKDMEVIIMNKPVIYFIEYTNSIKFFQNGVSFDMIKNEITFKQFNKIKNKYNFIDLLA